MAISIGVEPWLGKSTPINIAFCIRALGRSTAQWRFNNPKPKSQLKLLKQLVKQYMG
jgi:hypothetical protein